MKNRSCLYADVRHARPLGPGKISRPGNEYKRCGTANIFRAVELLAGTHFTVATPNRSAPQLAQALKTIIDSYPEADTTHLLGWHPPKSRTPLIVKSIL